ncbi:GAF domain-containing protein [Nocardioides sp. HDW12B]|uniref:sensor histidine kinase n=1 Tax=Nocardioides sp. HDW12B TaxID=2714939 RepID=UPI00140C7A4C|nr:GAF domain-containing protein [Nocardioides sp. HDW12B]QIK67793.1 GAF domain-containing protein [Nocardioides sp. HDW12B]
MTLHGVDRRLHHVLQRLPRILRSDRAPRAVLREIAATARELCESDYAFAALLDEERGFSAIGSSGLPAELEELLTSHPALLRARAAVLEQEGTVRLSLEAIEVPASRTGETGRRSAVTFGELMAVRLRAGVRTVGIVVLANRPGAGPLGPEADELLAELGRALGSAMDNALLLREVLHARRWMRAATTLTQQLLGDEIDEPLREVSERAMDLAGADFTIVALIQGTHMHVQHVSGLDDNDSLSNRVVTLPDSTEMETLRRGDALVYGDLSQVSAALFEGVDTSTFGPALVIPLIGAESLTGVLLLGRLQDGQTFSHSELDLASAFAAQASVALELESARQVQEKLLLVEERDRIARDLHDHVVQRLFATGLSLHGVVNQLEGDQQQRVSDAMFAIDETIRQIRNTILTLKSSGGDSVSLTDMVTDIADEAARLLGFAPILALDPGLRSVRGALADDMAACVREALSNVVRHAGATQVIIKASVHLGQLELSVADDGVGIVSNRRSGLGNLDKRARNHGGTMHLDSTPGHGSTLTWRVPVIPA